MKIVWVYRVRVDEPTHITTWRETHRFLKERHQIHYIFPFEREKKGFSPDIEFVPTLRWPYLKRLSLIINGWIAFFRIDRKIAPDVVILDHWSFFYPLIYLFRRRRPKVVLDVRTPEYNRDADDPSLGDILLRWYSKLVLIWNRRFHDGITLISERMAVQLERDLSVTLHPNRCIWPSGVDADFFSPVRRERAGSHSELTLLFHGSMTGNRGLMQTLEAVRLLKDRSVRVRLLLIGAGPEEARLKEATWRLGIEEQVSFLGGRPYEEIPRLIAGADLAVMAYPRIEYWEANVPLKILEYMAMEIPLLCTDLEVFRQLTSSKPFAHLIEDNQPKTIADGVEWAANNLESMRAAAPEGRRLVMERYSWRAVSDTLDGFLRAMVAD